MTTPAENPARVFFGAELRRNRNEADLTGKQLADALGCTPQWISIMESGRKVSEQSAHDLDTYFKTDGHFHRLWKLAYDFELTTSLPPGFAEYAERETEASTIRVYSAVLLTGLFQTEDYARTVMTSMEVSVTSDLIDKRMKRKDIFTRDKPPRVWLTLDEAILRRNVGTSEVMRNQLAFLLEVSEWPNVMLDVVPHSVGYYAGLGGSFTLLGFEDGRSVAYTESAGVGMLIEQPNRVATFGIRYDMLRGYALPVRESRALLQTAMEDLE